ncbi:MAG: M48 family metallopeptidase [Burkholderiaceae bacterium]|nr:M48 family metallopeptidase [Burkholderiaceae bacterium]
MGARKLLAALFDGRQLSLFGPEPVVAPPLSTPPQAPNPTPNPAARGERSVLLDGSHRVAYTLRRARRRTIGFAVGPEGLAVSAPRWVLLADIESALQEKSGWILRKLVEQRERAERLQASRIEWRDGAELPYLGGHLRMRLDASRSGAVLDAATGVLHVGLSPLAEPAQLRDVVQAWLQRQARAHFEPRCREFAVRLGVQMKQLRLSSAQTRWGSASADGTIRLNWRLVHYAPAIIDYVVVHELAHLREMNHSPRFWDVVRSVMPDFETARGLLREESLFQPET